MRRMDRAFIAAGIVSLSMLIAVSSCDRNAKESKPTRDALESTIEKDKWKITYSGRENQLKIFDGYLFSFSGNRSIVATKNNVSVSGVWSTFEAAEALKLNFEFSGSQPFDALTDDWIVVEHTDSKITLEHASEARERLTLERV